MAELTTKLACAAEGERRAKEQLEIRKDVRNTEVTDLQNEVSWFRGEYDQLLLKVSFDPIMVIMGHLGTFGIIWGRSDALKVTRWGSNYDFGDQNPLEVIAGHTLYFGPKMIKNHKKATKND